MRRNRHWFGPLALLALRAVSAQAQDTPSTPIMSVGRNVQVSKQFATVAHSETWAAGDPDHAGRLIACSMVMHQEPLVGGAHCYASFDNGTTWSSVLELDHSGIFDPSVTYARGDTAFMAVMAVPAPPSTVETTLAKGSIRVYRSADGGKNWKAAGAVFPFRDRESLVVDKTNGKYAGRVYLTTVSPVLGIDSGMVWNRDLFRSTDGGSTFLGPVQRAVVPDASHNYPLYASNSVVLSDGSVALLRAHIKKGRSENVLDESSTDGSANAQLRLLTSTDGGESLNPVTTVAEMYMDRRTSEGAATAWLAVDPGSRFFQDRLYVVWPDAAAGRIDIRFAYSADKGKTWSRPIRVNDDRPPPDDRRGPDHILPTIAVNKAGAVLVAWYDRRDSDDNMGWNIRAAASLDGGVTFTPSTLVSDAPSVFTAQTEWTIAHPSSSFGPAVRRGDPLTVNVGLNGFLTSAGHTSGLAVGRDGVFHPVWVDNRTGVAQLWTAPVTVRGTVERHGARELAELDDVTDMVRLEAQSGRYDRATNTLTLTGMLRNTSTITLRAPLKVRVVGLSSQLGAPAIVGADNRVASTGAIWDFGGAVPAAGLPPHAATAARTLTFRLSDVRPIRLTRSKPRWTGSFTSGLVNFDVRVFGTADGAMNARGSTSSKGAGASIR